MKKVVVSFLKTEFHSYKELVPFQDDLKDLTAEDYQKLKEEILRDGFAEPFTVWEHDNKIYTLNGHQRLRTLSAMEREGFEIPDMPCSFVRCKNEKEAKGLILALTSQLGRLNKDRLYEFQHKIGMSIDDLKLRYRFAEIDMRDYEIEYFLEKDYSNANCEYPIIPMFSEKYDYVIVMTTNKLDWNNLVTMLGLDKSKSYKSESVGIGHVIKYDDFLNAINKRKEQNNGKIQEQGEKSV